MGTDAEVPEATGFVPAEHRPTRTVSHRPGSPRPAELLDLADPRRQQFEDRLQIGGCHRDATTYV